MPDTPKDPIDPNYERGIEVAHELHRDGGNSLFRFTHGLIAELSELDQLTALEQLRVFHGMTMTLTAVKHREALFYEVQPGEIERQLGGLLASAYREHVGRQRKASPRNK